MYQPQELFNNLTPSEISRTLRLSGIPEKELYTENDADRFRECRTLIEQGGNDEEVMALLSPVVDVVLSETQDNFSPSTKNGRKKSGEKAVKPLDITELLSLAREIGFKLTLTKALQVLTSCGLKEQDEYTPSESERFLGALTKVGQQAPDVLIDMEDITTASEKALAGLVDQVTDRLVEKIPLGLVKQVYTQKAIARLAQQPEESDDFFIELSEGIMRQLEGKPPMESPLIQLMEKHQIKLLPPTSIKSMQLLNESESDTTTS